MQEQIESRGSTLHCNVGLKGKDARGGNGGRMSVGIRRQSCGRDWAGWARLGIAGMLV